MVTQRVKDYYLGALVGMLMALSLFLNFPGFLILAFVVLVISILFGKSLLRTAEEEERNARD